MGKTEVILFFCLLLIIGLVLIFSIFLLSFVSAESCNCGCTTWGGGTDKNLAKYCIPGYLPPSGLPGGPDLTSFIYGYDPSITYFIKECRQVFSSCTPQQGCCNGQCFNLTTEKCCSNFYMPPSGVQPVGPPDYSGKICFKDQTCVDTNKDGKADNCTGTSIYPPKSCIDRKSGSVTKYSKIYPADHIFTKEEIDQVQNDVIMDPSHLAFLNNQDGFSCPTDKCKPRLFYNGIEFFPGNIEGVKKFMTKGYKNIEYPDDPSVNLITEVGTFDEKGFDFLPNKAEEKSGIQMLDWKIQHELDRREYLFSQRAQLKNPNYEIKRKSDYKIIILPQRERYVTDIIAWKEKLKTSPNAPEPKLNYAATATVDYEFKVVKKEQVQLVESLNFVKTCEDLPKK